MTYRCPRCERLLKSAPLFCPTCGQPQTVVSDEPRWLWRNRQAEAPLAPLPAEALRAPYGRCGGCSVPLSATERRYFGASCERCEIEAMRKLDEEE